MFKWQTPLSTTTARKAASIKPLRSLPSTTTGTLSPLGTGQSTGQWALSHVRSVLFMTESISRLPANHPMPPPVHFPEALLFIYLLYAPLFSPPRSANPETQRADGTLKLPLVSLSLALTEGVVCEGLLRRLKQHSSAATPHCARVPVPAGG